MQKQLAKQGIKEKKSLKKSDAAAKKAGGDAGSEGAKVVAKLAEA